MAIIRATCGRFWWRSAGAASVLRAGRWSVTRKPSVTGRRSLGRTLKKSPKRAANDGLARRERTQPAAAPLPDLVAAGPHTGAAVPLQLEDAFRHRGDNAVEFLLPFVSRSEPRPQAVAFLKHLLRHIPGNLLLVWDRLPAHRSRVVQEFVAAQNGRIHTAYLPAYAPELNPTEYVWGHCKHHKLPNACPEGLRRIEARRPARSPQHAPPPNAHHRLLETGFLMARFHPILCGVQ